VQCATDNKGGIEAAVGLIYMFMICTIARLGYNLHYPYVRGS